MGIIYEAFGCLIRSDIELPELLQAESQSEQAQISITQGKVPERLENPIKKTPWYMTTEREILIRVDGIAAFYLKDGSEIVIEIERGAEESVGTLLANNILPYGIQQRGIPILHAAGVNVDGKGVLICGHTQSGKSTIAMALFQRGFKLLGDEACGILLSENGIVLGVPSFPQIGVWQDHLERIKYPLSEIKPVRKGIHKYGISIRDFYQKDPIPITHCIFLDSFNKMETVFKTVDKGAKMEKIYNNSLRSDLVENRVVKGEHFRVIAATCSQTKNKEYSFNLMYHSVEEVTNEILQEVRRSE